MEGWREHIHLDITASMDEIRRDGSFAFSTTPNTGGLFDSFNVSFDSVRRNAAASFDVLCV